MLLLYMMMTYFQKLIVILYKPKTETTMPKSVIPSKPEFLGWKYFKDFGDESHVFCLLCASVEAGKLYKVRNCQAQSRPYKTVSSFSIVLL